jgi:prepilin-type N-terminal cleavage/methylation domain-containing protein
VENVKTMKKKNKLGFSLMELLAVMAIMGILSTLAVTGYFSAVRSMARRRAVSNLMAALMQARQRACIDGTRTVLVCYNVKSDASSSDLKTIAPTYVVCKALGRVTCTDPRLAGTAGGTPVFGDEFTPLDTIFNMGDSTFGSRRLYNLSPRPAAKWTDVSAFVAPGAYSGKQQMKSPISEDDFGSPALLWCFIKAPGPGAVDNGDWKIGDMYGVDVSPPASFPKNVFFGGTLSGGNNTDQIKVMFNPDGTAKGQDIDVVAQDGKNIATITVENTGNIKGGDKINLN